MDQQVVETCTAQDDLCSDPEPVGTLIGPATTRNLARPPAYADSEILPIRFPAWHFYRLAA